MRFPLVMAGFLVTLHAFHANAFVETPGSEDSDAAAKQSDTTAFDSVVFTRTFLRAVDPELQRQQLDIAEQHLDDPQVAETLQKVITASLRQRKHSEALLDAVRLFCRLEDPRLQSKQLQFAQHKLSLLAAHAADELSRRDVPEALDCLLALTRRRDFNQSFGLRRLVVDALARYKTADSVDTLIDLMEKYPGQLQFEIAKHLENMTGQNFGGMAGEWKAWRQQSIRGGRARIPADKKEVLDREKNKMAWPDDVPAFFRTDIYGKRILFVLDLSRSMLSSVDGTTRIDEVRSELQRALSELTESTYFNVLAYNERREFWQKKPVPATPEAIAEAIQFATRLDPARRTNIHEALTAAVKHDEGKLELIVFLSDGKPTHGRTVEQRHIVNSIKRLNRHRKITIHTIGLDTSGKDAEFMKNLAAGNSGTYRSVR